MFKKENLKITIPSTIIFITTMIMMILEVQNLTTPTDTKWYELIIAMVIITSTHYLAYQIGKKRKKEA